VPPHAAAPHTVLVVDDDPSIRLLCRVNLELAGHRVVEAATLEAAAAALADEQPAVLILDVHVGKDDGRAFLPEVRELHPRVRVAMLTGTANVEDVRAAQPDAVLPKPFDPGVLVETVERLAAEARV
jgi:DNA-binding NtrC family response regulator